MKKIVGVVLATAMLSLLNCVGLNGNDIVYVDEDASSADAASGVVVNVSHAQDTQVVDLGTLSTVDVEGVPLATMASVVSAAFSSLNLSNIQIDLLAADGFRPRQSPYCETIIPVAGDLLTQGYVDPVTRNASWDSSLNFPNCMRVNDVATIEVSDR